MSRNKTQKPEGKKMTIKELYNLFGTESIVSDLNIAQATPADKYPDRFQVKFTIDKKPHKTFSLGETDGK